MLPLLALLLPLVPAADPVGYPARAKKWEGEVAKIEAKLRDAPPAAGGVLFLGSSSVRLWDLDKMLPEVRPINTGFGGSEVRDVTHFFPRLAPAARPRAAVIYAGDNDIASGRTPAQVRADSAALVKAIHAKYPGLPVTWIGIKPSVKRRDQRPQQAEANRLVAADCAADPTQTFLDVAPLMVDAAGDPDPKLFAADGLHLSAAGYAKWTALLRKSLAKE